MTLLEDGVAPRPDTGVAPVTIVGTGRLAGATAARLAHAGTTSIGVASWSDGFGPTELVVLCLDCPDPMLALTVNARCLASGTPLLAGLVLGRVAQVGPLVRAGRGPCLRCVDLRIRAAAGRSAFDVLGPADDRLLDAVAAQLAQGVEEFLAGHLPHRADLTYLWADGASSRHHVLPTRECPDCSSTVPPPGFLRRHFDVPRPVSRDPEPVSAVRAALVDPLTGPIRSLERFDPEPHDPPFRHWVASLADPGWARFGLDAVVCGGTAQDDDAARAAAVGEALDRMAACSPGAVELHVAPYREVAPDAVHPAQWDVFDPSTRADPCFPYVPVSNDDPISWVWGWSLTADRPVLVPAARVFLSLTAPTAADGVQCPILSGFATGASLRDAALAGVLEVIERDALAIAWANRLRLPHMRHPWFEAFERKGVEVRCGVILLDLGAPVVTAMARGWHPDDPPIVVSAAAALEPEVACRRALTELAANRLHARHLKTTARELTPAEVGGRGAVFARLEPWWHGGYDALALRPGAAFPASLESLVAHIAGAGLTAIVVDVTPPGVEELGLRTVKVLVPGTYPIPADPRWPHHGGRRLTAAPVAAGLLEAPLPFEALERLPPPFP